MKKEPCTEDIIMTVIAVLFVGAMTMMMLTFTGCTHNIEKFKCKCDCEGKSTLECSSNEQTIEVEGR